MLLLASGFWSEKILVGDLLLLVLIILYTLDVVGHKYGYLSRMSPSNFHSETEDSGFESLVTVTSDSGSNSSRMVSPPPQPVAPQMINMRSANGHPHQSERSHYQYYNIN